MTNLIIDASIAVKWVVSEAGTDLALTLLRGGLAAPDLFTAECVNVLWKKVQRNELTSEEALLAVGILQRADIELYPMRMLMEPAAKLALDLDHPAYDCFYLALATANDRLFTTADERFLRRVRRSSSIAKQHIISLDEAAELCGR